LYCTVTRHIVLQVSRPRSYRSVVISWPWTISFCIAQHCHGHWPHISSQSYNYANQHIQHFSTGRAP